MMMKRMIAIGIMPKATMGTTPKTTVGIMPKTTVGIMPKTTVGIMPKTTIGVMPKTKTGTMLKAKKGRSRGERSKTRNSSIIRAAERLTHRDWGVVCQAANYVSDRD